MTRYKTFVLVAALAAMSGPMFAAARPGPMLASANGWLAASGKIRQVNLSYDNNYAFRIQLFDNGVDQLSNCSGSFVYVNNVAGENYQAKVATLLSAQAQGKTVIVYYIRDSLTFCHITDLVIQ